MRVTLRRSLLAVAVLLVMGIAYLAWVIVEGIPLTVTVRRGEVLIDTQEFGEYYSSISRIRLNEVEAGRTVWEAVSTRSGGTSPVWKFILKVGSNRQPEVLAGFHTITPPHDESFDLVGGRDYRITVWGQAILSRNSRRFTAPAHASEMGGIHQMAFQALTQKAVTVRTSQR